MLYMKTIFRTRIASLVFFALVMIAGVVSAQQRIMIVTDRQNDEAGYAEWLSGLGFEVTVSESEEFRGSLDEAQRATLEGFDLVIMSRNTNSGAYNEAEDWNGLNVPLLLHSAWLSRSSHWDWFNGTDILTRDADFLQVGSSRFAGENENTVPDFDHPIFDGVTIIEDAPFPTVSVRSTAAGINAIIGDPGAGQWILSDTQTGSQRPMMVDYVGDMGAAYYPGSGQTIVNRRFYFSFIGEYNIGSAEEWRGLFTGDGERILANAIYRTGDLDRTQSLPFHADFGSVRFIDFLNRTTAAPFAMEPVSDGGTVYFDDDATVDALPAGLSGNFALKTSNIDYDVLLEFPGAGQFGWVDTNLDPTALSFPLSFSIWTNRFDDGTNRNKIFGWFFDGGENRGELEIDHGANQLRLVWWGGDRIEVPAPPTNAWVHIGVVITEDDARLYVDGAHVGSLGEEESPRPLTDGSNLWIGARPSLQEGSFSGWLKDWVAFDGDIGDEGMEQLAAEAGMPDGTLLQHLPLGEGEGEEVFDASTNDLHGELFGTYSWGETTLAPDAPLQHGIGFVTALDLSVYLAVDAEAPVPAWISNSYTDLGESVSTTAGDFDLWRRDFAARERVSLLTQGREPGENNYWVILSEGPEAITPSPDASFMRSSANPGEWRLGAHNWTLATAAESAAHTAAMSTNLINFDAERGFRTSVTFRVPRLQDPGDNAVGLSLLGAPDGSGVRAEWLPRPAGGASSLRLVNAEDDAVLAEAAWTGAVPAAVDNNVGVASGAAETLFSTGDLVFADDGERVVFSEDFSTGDGWTSGSDNPATDQWEIGEPTTGPGSAFTGSNVAATNLNGVYATGGADTVAWLRSPVIDLTETDDATLRFQEFMDVDPFQQNEEFFHYGVISVLDADTMQELAEEVYNENISTWSERVLDLSGVAGRRIILEFALVTDEVDTDVGEGWYIDAVEVTVGGITIQQLPETIATDGTLYGISTDLAGVEDNNDDHLQFTVTDRSVSGNDGVTVYVAWDVRASGLEPAWLRDEFAQTDHFVGVTGAAGEHRLWAREYSDGDTVTLGGASAPGSGPYPASGINNYFVLFGDARPGLESFYTLTAEGVKNEGVWEIELSMSDSDGNAEMLAGTTGEGIEGSSFGFFARHPDAGGATVTHAPIWEVYAMSMGFLESLTGFQAWREENFPGQLDNPDISGPEASPAGDGVPNLMKYALDLAPFEPVSSEDLHTMESVGDGNIMLVFWKRTDIDDVVYIPEVSENLIDWSSGAPNVVETTGAVEGNLQEIEAVGSLPGDSERRFMRLRVLQAE